MARLSILSTLTYRLMLEINPIHNRIKDLQGRAASRRGYL
jgi:hypothetical protein